jgi:hypothetical protein
MHECEPKLPELQKIREELLSDTSSDNAAKLKAVEAQIRRHIAAAGTVA